MGNSNIKTVNLSKISTEGHNEHTAAIDSVSTLKLAKLINEQDEQITQAVKTQLPAIANGIRAIAACFRNGGRLVYIGAGTSGRLGVLDASEMPPTFGVSNKLVIGLIAGGDQAIRNPIEGAEDDEAACVRDLKRIKLTKKDVLVGISASGRTPYVISGLKYANKLGCKTISVATSSNSEIGEIAQIKIEAVTGPETIVGSTRMKSGTAQKMILNMLSTGAMIKIGKVYGNLMVDVQPTNQKLIARAHSLVKKITNADDKQIKKIMQTTHNQVKPAVVMISKKVNYQDALKLLKVNNQDLRKIIG
ncbi:MAG: N-acetylmuramic acid 6-phosphate etherase [Mycoplasmataceae bacterium]|jgi:N-acetylmuramic acid 6-phosphate etherase|nr:N-acetylmuramic acid 6-phosphate etherase [Mycoplasmataceae bacterium]